VTGALRTRDERFRALPDFPFEPQLARIIAEFVSGT
jgi:hypothetical protein